MDDGIFPTLLKINSLLDKTTNGA